MSLTNFSLMFFGNVNLFLAHEILWSDVLYSLEDWLSFYKNFFLSYKDHHKNIIEVSIKYLYLQIT